MGSFTCNLIQYLNNVDRVSSLRWHCLPDAVLARTPSRINVLCAEASQALDLGPVISAETDVDDELDAGAGVGYDHL